MATPSSQRIKPYWYYELTPEGQAEYDADENVPGFLDDDERVVEPIRCPAPLKASEWNPEDHPRDEHGRFLEKAIKTARAAHLGQKDKGGIEDYIAHPLRVMDAVTDPHAKMAAVLHDVVEDTGVTLDDLRKDFPREVVEAVDALTRRKDETYFNYIRRLRENPIAKTVKRADIADNLMPRRADVLPEAERKGLAKRYAKALTMLDE